MDKSLMIKAVVQIQGNALPLTVDQHRKIPCHKLYCSECVEKYFLVEYRPQSNVTDQMIVNQYIKKLKKDFKVINYEYYSTIGELRIEKDGHKTEN